MSLTGCCTLLPLASPRDACRTTSPYAHHSVSQWNRNFATLTKPIPKPERRSATIGAYPTACEFKPRG
jgi:hypothetical protein